MASHLGEFEQLVLFAVLRLKEREDGAYGVTIREEIEGRTGREVSAGAVYTTLSRLEARDLVSSRTGETTPERGGRRRKYYTLTPAGAALMQRSWGDIRAMADGLLGKLATVAGGGDPGVDR